LAVGGDFLLGFFFGIFQSPFSMAQHNALALPKARGDRRALAGEGRLTGANRLIVAKARYQGHCVEKRRCLIKQLVDIKRDLDGFR
jgi:hypothetical protein